MLRLAAAASRRRLFSLRQDKIDNFRLGGGGCGIIFYLSLRRRRRKRQKTSKRETSRLKLSRREEKAAAAAAYWRHLSAPGRPKGAALMAAADWTTFAAHKQWRNTLAQLRRRRRRRAAS